MRDELRQRAGRTLAVLATVLSVQVLGAVALANPSAPVAAQDPRPPAALSASGLAMASGTSVPIPELTDADSTTRAEPDGSFSTEISPLPQRVEMNGEWVALDPRLEHNADGTLSTAATTSPLTLSAGGSGPLAQLAAGPARMTLGWPARLPAPTVDGAVATYAGVLPGVDLRVTADPQGGIAEVLVVKSRTAAADPALRALKLTVRMTNATLHADAGGNLTAVDASGRAVFHAPTPMMWDSGVAASRLDDPSVAPPASAHMSSIGVGLARGEITLTPNQALLHDPNTTFPVFIDPYITTTKNQSGFAWAQEANPNTSWWNDNSNGRPAVGYQGWDASWQGRNRAYYQFGIGSLGSAHIDSAYLQLTEVDTGLFDCTAKYAIDVYSSNHIGSTTTWNNQPSRLGYQDTVQVTGASPDNGCAKKTFRWTVTSSIANDGDGTVTYRVQAPDGVECCAGNKEYYRRFGSNNAPSGFYTDTGAALEIHYNWSPDVPTALSLQPAPKNPNSQCDFSNVGWIGSQANGTVTLSANVSDNDQGDGQSVAADWHLWDKGGSGTGASDVIAWTDNTWTSLDKTTTVHGTVNKTVSTSVLANGHMYGWNARGDDNIDVSAPADPCYFWVDKTAPAMNPITSTAFRSDGTGTVTAGGSGTFTLSASDVVPSGANYSKVRCFIYSFSSASALPDNCSGSYVGVSPSGATATATISYSPTEWGTQYLYVQALDNALNASAVATYQFYVPDSGNHQVHPGDIDGDSHADLLGVVGNDLYLYKTAPTSGTHLPAPVLASRAGDSPDGVSWSGTLIAHRGAFKSATDVDDLWALKGGALYYYTNNRYSPTGLAGHNGLYFTYSSDSSTSVPVVVPPCPGCTSYTPQWSDVRQMIAPGDINRDGRADVIMAKTNGTLWFFPGTATTGVLGQPQRIGASGWNDWDLIAPGDSTGDGIPDVWARDNRTSAAGGSGDLRLYRVIVSSGVVSLASPIANTGAFWGPPTRKLAASPADTDGDGKPELYTIATTSDGLQLDQNEMSALSSTTFAITAHTVIDDGAGAVNWNNVTALS